MTRKKGFTKTADLLQYSYQACERLIKGQATVSETKAIATHIGHVARILNDRSKMAKEADILKKGSCVLPEIEFE